MFKNFILTALRNISKHKLFSLIDILGLSIGITVTLLIFFFIDYELSYDKQFKDYDKIYRVRYERKDADGQVAKFASCCPPGGLEIRKYFPEVKKIGRAFKAMASVSNGDKTFLEERIFYSEPELVDVLNLNFLYGNKQAFNYSPNIALISQSMANKYFGTENALNKSFSIDKKTEYKIVGIYKDFPQNSHIKMDFILSYSNILAKFGNDVEESWGDTGWFTYLILNNNIEPNEFEKKVNAHLDKGINKFFEEYKLRIDFRLQPLSNIHLDEPFQQEYEIGGDRNAVDYLKVIALLVIIISWVNYINLSTVKLITRAKEFGLRKVVGATKKQLFFQFLTESVLINVVAIITSVLLILFLLPAYYELTGISTDYFIWNKPWFILSIIGLFALGVISSSIYPIALFSSFKPSEVLHGKFGNSYGKIGLRKILVGFQFFMGFLLIICSLAVKSQLDFMKSQQLGFDKDNKLVVKAPRVRDSSFTFKLNTFKEQVLNQNIASNICVATETPGKQILWDAGGIFRVGSDVNKNYQIVGIDYNYAEVFDLKFAAGRNFSKEFSTDSLSLILNETAAKWLGFSSPQDAVGKQVSYWGVIYNVIGVLKDFHQQSLKQAFEPHIYRLTPTGRDVRGCFVFDFNSNFNSEDIKPIQKLYSEFFPGNSFDYYVLDEYFNRQYNSDEKFGKIVAIFSLLAIFITCLGVLGLVSFMISQKNKEIAIRKVLGASIYQIQKLILKDYLAIALISFVLATPISFLLINKWLESFAVKMEISPLLFIYSLLIVLLITFLTNIFNIYKASSVNLMNSLREE